MGPEIGGGAKGEGRRDEPHENDRKWGTVGKRCKLVCDSQVTVGLFNGEVGNTNKGMVPLIERAHNKWYIRMRSGWNLSKTHIVFWSEDIGILTNRRTT